MRSIRLVMRLMYGPPVPSTVRRAHDGDADAVGRLLHAFNTEFGDPTPPPDALAERMRALMAGGDTVVLVAGDGPDGLAVLRFREAIWDEALECYLAELYVVPDRRGEGARGGPRGGGGGSPRGQGGTPPALRAGAGDAPAPARP